VYAGKTQFISSRKGYDSVCWGEEKTTTRAALENSWWSGVKNGGSPVGGRCVRKHRNRGKNHATRGVGVKGETNEQKTGAWEV